MTLEEAQAKYGLIKDGTWPDEAKWCTTVTIPNELAVTWRKVDGPTKHIYCNKDMAPALIQAIQNAMSRGIQSELKTFDGCLMVRDVRGEPGKPSAHSYALAIDVNAATNQLGTVGDISPELVACFTDAGFSWGGNFSRKDPMHFSLCWE